MTKSERLRKVDNYLRDHGFTDVVIIAVDAKNGNSFLYKPDKVEEIKTICFEAQTLIHTLMMDTDVDYTMKKIANFKEGE